MDFDKHPCFSSTARHTTGRIHLPVAAKCNVQCKFCNRKYDCPNESRPGVTSTVLEPDQALTYLDSVLKLVPNIAVIGIAGPGDPLANPDETLKTMEMVHTKYPDKLLCLATNGMNLLPYVERLAKVNVSHVTITVNAVDPEIGAQIYQWFRFGPHTYRGVEGAHLLLTNQLEAIKALKAHGITVKINTVVIPGINDHHVGQIAAVCKELGADVQNCIPMMHVEGSLFEGREPPDALMMVKVRGEAGQYMKQMTHCARCRADAVGLIGQDNSAQIDTLLHAAAVPRPTTERPYIAVASMEGIFVNRHLGEAPALWVFDVRDGGVKLVGQRPTPEPGASDLRWHELADTFHDCFAALVSGCGSNPKKVLGECGLKVIAAEGLIQDILAYIARGEEIPKMLLHRAGSCNAGKGCGGQGMGCG